MENEKKNIGVYFYFPVAGKKMKNEKKKKKKAVFGLLPKLNCEKTICIARECIVS